MMMGGIGILNMIFWILVLGLLIYGVYLLIEKATGKSGGSSSDSALKTLKERLARGEIDEEEYERLKSVLEKD
jgi:putative membrane protein